MLKSPFSKVAGLQVFRFQYRCFPLTYAKFLETPILKNIDERLLLLHVAIVSDFLLVNIRAVFCM